MIGLGITCSVTSLLLLVLPREQEEDEIQTTMMDTKFGGEFMVCNNYNIHYTMTVIINNIIDIQTQQYTQETP